jgi:uncharacterized membrane protein
MPIPSQMGSMGTLIGADLTNLDKVQGGTRIDGAENGFKS